MDIKQKCIEEYEKIKNLKVVGEKVGIPWQTVYVHLKSAGVNVVGDKKRYGSTSDKLAAKFEEKFKQIVPFAKDNNSSKYQAKVDFFVGSHSVDVKCAHLKPAGVQDSGKKFSSRWGYCINKQKNVADFFVLFALNDDDSVRHIFLMPKEIAITATTISIPGSMKSKWADYKVSEKELREFFEMLLNAM